MQLLQWLKSLCEAIEERKDKSAMVAVDTVRFTSAPYYQCSYSPEGG